MILSLRWSLFAVALPVVLAACTGGSPQPQPPSASVNEASGDSAPPAASSAAAPSTAASAPPSAAADAAPKSTITNEPPAGGTVTSNAGPTPAGSDRMQPMMDLVKANRDGFRKCFDLWGKKNPGQAGKIAFQFFLKVDGTLEKAAIKPDEGDIHAAEVENCMIAFAKTLSYPKSGVGKETVYTHRFDFKAAPK
jgi:hypothetical protein